MADIMLSCTNPAVLPVMKYVMKKSRNYSLALPGGAFIGNRGLIRGRNV